jgi:hypothetical protein
MDADVRKKCERVLFLSQRCRRANRGDDEDLVHDREEVDDGDIDGDGKDVGVSRLDRVASDTSGTSPKFIDNFQPLSLKSCSRTYTLNPKP